MYVAADAPVKFAVLKISNQSDRSAPAFGRRILGMGPGRIAVQIADACGDGSGCAHRRDGGECNPYNTEFGDVIAFVDVNDSTRSITGDRTEFLGRNGTLANPAALGRRKLSGKIGAGLDPCAALLLPLELADGQQRDLVFIFGAGQNIEEVRHLVQRFRSTQAARKALDAVSSYWTRTLGTVQVETPDPSVNVLANGWLVYQTLACRMWARSGFYQSGGAYGFRDQLQDSMALVHAEPGLVREHLLRCAGHQFREGDVQHWWHPPSGRGVRTHFSDDFLWLPYVTCRYVMSTGDTGVLDERVNYLEGRLVKPEEEAYYDLPARSQTNATLYEHCVAAVENGLKFGARGLPLMGCGDWNDGMNLVGEQGEGESVWLAFFLFYVLEEFAKIARRRGRCGLRGSLHRASGHASGKHRTPRLGWPVVSSRLFRQRRTTGLRIQSRMPDRFPPAKLVCHRRRGRPQTAEPGRWPRSMRGWIRRDSGIIQLFTPPFDKSSLNPGYIKGYVPGVRENGGQYTHAAIWTTPMAFAAHGRSRPQHRTLCHDQPLVSRGGSEGIHRHATRSNPTSSPPMCTRVAPHTGRGGWTWYTGSAGWMYRLIVETLLGLTREPERLCIKPRKPATWDGFTLHYRFRETVYHITISKAADGVARVVVDGVVSPDGWIGLLNDSVDHHATVQLIGWDRSEEEQPPTTCRRCGSPELISRRLNSKKLGSS